MAKAIAGSPSTPRSARVSAIYIAAPEGGTGKSTVALGILHRLTAVAAKVGVFRPIIQQTDGGERDGILQLLLAHASADLSYQQCRGVSYAQLHRDEMAAMTEIVDRFHAMADHCDVVVIVGSDYTDIATPAELTVNARIAVNLGAPVLLVVPARHRRASDVAHVVHACLTELAAQHAHTAAVVANRCEPTQLAAVADALGNFTPPTYVLPEEPVLDAPTVADLHKAVHGTLISGDTALMGRAVMGVLVAGMTAEHALGRLSEAAAVITAGDRSDIVLAVASAHAAEGFPSLACVIVHDGLTLHPAIATLVINLGLRLPIMSTALDATATITAIAAARGRITVGGQRKVDTALELMERHVDLDDLLVQLAVPIPTVTTPQMFTYRLRQWARGDRQHLNRIVLPEGDEDRILRAAGRILQRRIADLTILGEENFIRSRATELGISLDNAAIVNPRTSGLCDQFAAQYAQLRAHKGVGIERANETIRDVSYFGAMLVHNGLVDGMVSGAAHSTAHTVRPAFEIIGTAPQTGLVSSVFFMCLPDQVLVYGDCAIVPDPTCEQLADIAISSARTAARFGIEPRVAMLSYATGESATGIDVDKVRAATQLVRSRAPDLPVEGPIQYDAAVVPSVAASKMGQSPVA
ncbi:MAG: phosphate acetyltransferase, partial [Mycobacteriaceae bacterium]|nr:phosphate acetyltransferase [Mycobacteriaceae bacterium]